MPSPAVNPWKFRAALHFGSAFTPLLIPDLLLTEAMRRMKPPPLRSFLLSLAFLGFGACFLTAFKPRGDRTRLRSVIDLEDTGALARRGVLQTPGVDEAILAFRKKFPQVMASPNPSYLGTSCSEDDLRRRFQALGNTIGREEALSIATKEPLLLAMQEDNLKASWEALIEEVCAGDRLEALRLVRQRPVCLVAPADGFKGKSKAEFEAVAEAEDAFRPVTNTLKEIGPEGLALGAAALGVAALGAFASKGAPAKAAKSFDKDRKTPIDKAKDPKKGTMS